MSILNDTSSMEQPRGGMWDSHPKTTFWMGVFLGFSVSSFIALVCVLMLVLSGRGGSSAVAAAPSAAPSQVAAADPSAAAQQDPPSKPPAAVTDKDHVLGAKDAKVTMIEYSDFQCPYCGRHEPTIEQALKDFPKDVRLVYRHYPLSFHENAQKAAEASECASKLGGPTAFWKMHDQLFANNSALSPTLYVSLAKGMGLDEAKFKACLDSGETAQIIAADTATGNDAGVNGTPATYINGQLVSGAVPYAQFKTILAQAGAKQ